METSVRALSKAKSMPLQGRGRPRRLDSGHEIVAQFDVESGLYRRRQVGEKANRVIVAVVERHPSIA